MDIIRSIGNWRNAHQFEILFVVIGFILFANRRLYIGNDKKLFNKYGLIMSGVYCIVVIYVTIISRNMGIVTDYNHEIFWSYKLALYDNGYLEQIVLNILLFTPLGILWAGLIDSSKRYQYIIAVIAGGLLSGFIECLQYHLQCGFSEIDDAISNTLGVVFGITTWEVIRRIRKYE